MSLWLHRLDVWINVLYCGNPINKYLDGNTNFVALKLSGGLCYSDFIRSEIVWALGIVEYFFLNNSSVFSVFYSLIGKSNINSFCNWLSKFMRSVYV